MPKEFGSMYNSHVTIDGAVGSPFPAPNAIITFAAVPHATTRFEGGTWITTVPVTGTDDIFLSGLTLQVGLTVGDTKTTWSGEFFTATQGLSINWKFGAAVYKMFSVNYNDLNVKAAHQNALGSDGLTMIDNGLQAGTPVTYAKSSNCIQGARGGGSSNFTGSWSGTLTVKLEYVDP